MANAEIIPLIPSEYAPYYIEYTEHLDQGTLEDVLQSDWRELIALFDSLTEEKALYRYDQEKWSIKEMLVHCMDTEVIFNARALMFARGEQNPIPGYDHESYVRQSGADRRSLDEIRETWSNLRKMTLSLFGTFSDEELKKMGNANGNKMSVRSLIYIIPGHVLHHLGVLREKYGIDF
jgi:hypothetical protein